MARKKRWVTSRTLLNTGLVVVIVGSAIVAASRRVHQPHHRQ